MPDIGTDSFIQIKDGDWDNLNRALRYIYNQLDAITGRRGLGADPTQKYTPVITDPVNLADPVVVHQTSFVRVLDTVIVFGEVIVNQDVADLSTHFEMSLPIVSKFVQEWDGAGVAFCPGVAGFGASLLAGVANQTAIVQWVSGNTGTRKLLFVFVYHVN